MKRRLVGCLFITMLTLLLVPATAASAATAKHRLANVRVPAYCRMPAQRLHDNKTAAKYLPKQGGIEFTYVAAPILVHVRHSGTQLLAQYGCTAGGVSWPEVLVLYSKGNHLIASLRLERYAKTEHSQVDSWHAASGHKVVVNWTSYEGAGFEIRHHHSTLTLRKKHLQLH